MADEWSSLAYSLIPGAIGAAAGGPALGLYGLTSGLAAAEQGRTERDRLAADIQYKNATLQQHQQTLNMQAGNYERLNKLAEVQASGLEVERKKHELELLAATRTREGMEWYALNQPAEKRAQFLALPDNQKHEFILNDYKEKDFQAKVKNSVGTLERLGLSREDAIALGPQGLPHVLGQLMTDKPFSMYIDPYSGFAYLLNQRAKPGQEITRLYGGGGKAEAAASPERRTAVEKSMLDVWRKMYPTEAKLQDEGVSDLSKYNAWRQSEEGQLYHDNFYQKLTPEQFTEELSNIGKRDKQLTEQAKAEMKKRYMKQTGTPSPFLPQSWQKDFVPTDETFKEYLESDPGKDNLEKWREHLRPPRGRKPWDDPPERPTPPGQTRPGGPPMELPPPPGLNRGKFMYDTHDGVWKRSNGTMWIPVPQGPPPRQ